MMCVLHVDVEFDGRAAVGSRGRCQRARYSWRRGRASPTTCAWRATVGRREYGGREACRIRGCVRAAFEQVRTWKRAPESTGEVRQAPQPAPGGCRPTAAPLSGTGCVRAAGPRRGRARSPWRTSHGALGVAAGEPRAADGQRSHAHAWPARAHVNQVARTQRRPTRRGRTEHVGAELEVVPVRRELVERRVHHTPGKRT